MPKYQLAKGCLVDQLVGQYMAHICGLGYLAPKEHIKTTLQSILKYNSRESMAGHFNNMRSYALGDEAALLRKRAAEIRRVGNKFRTEANEKIRGSEFQTLPELRTEYRPESTDHHSGDRNRPRGVGPLCLHRGEAPP